MRSHLLLRTLLLFTFVSSGINSLQAQTTFSPLAPAQGFNVFTSGSITASAGDTHGPVACGGDMILNGSTIFSMNTSGTFPTGTLNDANNYGMVIGGKVQYISGNTTQLNQGYLRIGNTTGSTIWYTDNNNATTNLKLTAAGQPFSSALAIQTTKLHPAGSATTASGLNFSSAFSTMTANSSLINDMYGNAACASQFNFMTIPAGSNPQINLAPNKINYINLTGIQLNQLVNQGSIIFNNNPSSNKILVFNINAGSSFVWNTPNFAGISEADGAYIIWNFYGLSNLTIQGGNSTYGTIFAPLATISKNAGNNANGQVVGSSFVMNFGEVHYYPFTAQLPLCPSGGPLPVKNIELNAALHSSMVNLDWKVTGQENIKEYQVEKSIDGVNFYAISTVPVNARAVYSSVDPQVSAAVTYYRVAAVEVTGQKYFSKIISVRSAAANGVQVWPNPVADKLYISYQASEKSQLNIQLLNGTGAVVLQRTVSATTGMNQVYMDGMKELAAGIYLLRINTAANAAVYTQRIIKN